jgi:fumarate reductase flavoprotein subunit
MVRELLPEMRTRCLPATPATTAAPSPGAALGARWPIWAATRATARGHVPQGALITWALMMEGGVQVNARGERFHDETEGYSEAARAGAGAARRRGLGRVRRPAAGAGPDLPGLRRRRGRRRVRHAADVPALAALIGCDPPRCRPRWPARDCKARLHAIKVTGALFHTQGGLDIDAHCRVQRADGTPLPNLLAAGGAARGVSGGAIWGYLSGNGLLSAVAGGHIAARTAQALLETA